MTKFIKRLITIAVVIVVLVVGYNFFLKKDRSKDSLETVGTLPSEETEAVALSDEFVGLLLNMETIKLDGSIFSRSSFTTLEDFSITLVQLGNEGRPNPFAPIGSDILPTTVTPVEEVSTGTVSSITTTTAMLNGSLASGVVATERWFEWGLTTSLGAQTIKLIGSTTPFSQSLAGLSPSTTYYVKAAAKINGQSVYGALVSFKTNALE